MEAFLQFIYSLDSVKNIGILVGGIVLMIFRETVRLLVKKCVDWIIRKCYVAYTTIKNLTHKSGRPSAKTVNTDTEIGNLLQELRKICGDANRATVFQYHNGNYFASLKSILKISGTHEKIKNATSSEVHNEKDLIASNFSEMISPMWNYTTPEGITRLSPKYCTCTNVKDCKTDVISKCQDLHGIFLFDVDAMEDSSVKYQLIKRGIIYRVVTALTDDQNRIGFLAIDYTTTEHTKDDITTYITDICDTALIIAHMLTEK